MWSLFGYLVIFFIVVVVLYYLWSMRVVILGLAILGIFGYFITNHVLRDADMSENNVKKTTLMVLLKADKVIDFMEEWNHSTEYDTVQEPEPEPEGFAVTE